MFESSSSETNTTVSRVSNCSCSSLGIGIPDRFDSSVISGLVIENREFHDWPYSTGPRLAWSGLGMTRWGPRSMQGLVLFAEPTMNCRKFNFRRTGEGQEMSGMCNSRPVDFVQQDLAKCLPVRRLGNGQTSPAGN